MLIVSADVTHPLDIYRSAVTSTCDRLQPSHTSYRNVEMPAQTARLHRQRGAAAAVISNKVTKCSVRVRYEEEDYSSASYLKFSPPRVRQHLLCLLAVIELYLMDVSRGNASFSKINK